MTKQSTEPSGLHGTIIISIIIIWHHVWTKEGETVIYKNMCEYPHITFICHNCPWKDIGETGNTASVEGAGRLGWGGKEGDFSL